MSREPIGMTLAEDPITQHRRACEGFTRAVSLAEGSWDKASPCTEWDARGVLEHVIGFHDELVLKPLDAKPSRPKDDPVGRWTVTAEALSRALAQPGVMDDRSFLIGVLATEVLIHTWDLSRAIGIDVVLDAELCEIGYERAKANQARLEASDAFGPVVAVPDDANIQERLLGIFGRDPYWTSPPR